MADPRLVADVTGATSMPDPAAATEQQWRTFWLKWPLTHLTNAKAGRALFRIEGDRFAPNFTVDDARGADFDAMAEEIVEWRLAEYLLRSTATASGAIPCKVIQTNGRPIIMLDRDANPALPSGDVVVLVDGVRHVAKFVKIAVNVLRRDGDGENVLGEVLRGWFGLSAGQPGTGHAVVFEAIDGQWRMNPSVG